MDLVTRLLLQTGQFDSNIQKSTKQIQSFQNAGSAVTGAIGKLAAGLGLAMGAQEAFTRTMEATQTTSDMFARVTEQGSTALDTFFASLSKADFSNFLSNMKNAISQAGSLADALDLLDQKNLFNNAELNSLEAQRQIQLNIAKDRTKSNKERLAAEKEVEKIDKNIFKLRDDLGKANKTAYYRGVRTEVAKQGFTGTISNGMIDTALKGSNQAQKDAAVERYNKKVAELNDIVNKHTKTVTSGVGIMASNSREIDAEGQKAKAELAHYKSTSIDAYYKAISEIGEKNLQIYVDKRNEANNQMVANSTAILERNLAKAKIEGSYNKLNGATEKVINKGSIDEVDAQLNTLAKKFAAATSDELRASIQSTITELENKKFKLQFQAEYGSQDENLAQIIKQPEIKGAKVDYKIGENIGKKKEKSDGWIDYVDINEIKPAYSKTDVKVNNDYVESLNAISNVMGSITNLTNEGATAWLSWSANLLTSIAMAIPAISALIAVKKTEAVTNGVASATQTPLVGWLLAGAAAISVVAALASIPKFASGGIVAGNSYSGDNILAGLNSGEMVLNKTQQGNLFAILNGNNSGNSGSNGGSQTIELKVKGTDLVTVLNNYNKKTNKIR